MHPVSGSDDSVILKQLRDGSEHAFHFFYKKYSAQIYKKLFKMTRISSLSEEILQEVFVKIWEKRQLIDPEKSFRSYLFQIAQNQMYDFYRKVARDQRLQLEMKKVFNELEHITEQRLDLKETEQVLNLAIDHLPPQQKLVFRLCKLEGKSYEEVGTTLGISTSTINGHIVKATKSIKTFMCQYEKVAFNLLIAVMFENLN